MMIRNKVTTLLLAVVFACTTFFTTTASAKEVNTSLASSPTATLAAIDSIGTPLSNQAAGEVRGEFAPIILAYAVMYGIPASYLAAAVVSRSSVPIARVAYDAYKAWFP